MYCSYCGANNPSDAAFCQKCGKSLPTTEQDESTILTADPALSPTYGYNPSANTTFDSSEPLSAPPPPPDIFSDEKARSTGTQSSSIAPRPKHRRGYAIAVVLLVLVVIAAVGAYVYLNRSTPDNTLKTYYSALKSGDYQTAYAQLSTTAQGRITEQGFAQFWQALGGVKAWSETSLQEQSTTATAALSLTLGNGQTRPASIPLVIENGVWKIDNETIG